jgi:hypothetical protein
MGGGAAHGRCLVEGCQRRGVRIAVGAVVLTFCPEHKAQFDKDYVDKLVRACDPGGRGLRAGARELTRIALARGHDAHPPGHSSVT